jgi:PGF-pre-PGF domain-containing protein
MVVKGRKKSFKKIENLKYLLIFILVGIVLVGVIFSIFSQKILFGPSYDFEVSKVANSPIRDSSIAIDSFGISHIAYYDFSDTSLKYCDNSGGDWTGCEVVDNGIFENVNSDVGIYNSIVIDSNNKVHISYYDSSDTSLKYCDNLEGIWDCNVIDGSGTSVNYGRYSSIDVDSEDNIHIAYYDATDDHLRYCEKDSFLDEWEPCVEIDDPSLMVGSTPSIAIDSEDNVHISHYDVDLYNLRYCNNLEEDWGCNAIDTTGDVGDMASIAIDSEDNVHISHYDFTTKNLRYCENKEEGPWNCYAVEITANNDGEYSSIAIDSEDNTHISYYDSTDLIWKYCNNLYGSWNCKDLVSGSSSSFLSYFGRNLAIDSDNNLHNLLVNEGGDLYHVKTIRNNVYECDSCVTCNADIASAFPGEVVQLQKSLSAEIDGDCIDFQGKEHITFDCGTHTNKIIGNSDATGYGIDIEGNHNEVKNCQLVKFGKGIYLEPFSASNTTLTNIISYDNEEGISLTHNDNNSLSLIVLKGNNKLGIDITDSSWNKFEDFTSEDNLEEGIYLMEVNNSVFSNILTRDNAIGISLIDSRGNSFEEIVSDNNPKGIYIEDSEYNVFSEMLINRSTTLTKFGKGISIEGNSDYNTIKNSIIEGNNIGIHFEGEDDSFNDLIPNENIVYNNYFNNSWNYRNSSSMTNSFNIAKTSGTNIAGGIFIGGNYWTSPKGNYSNTCADTNNDGLCDVAYDLDSVNLDNFALTDYVFCEEDWNCTKWSSCVDGTRNRTCNDLNDCGTENDKEDEDNCGDDDLKTESKSWTDVEKDEIIEMELVEDDMGLTKISIEVNENVSEVDVEVNEKLAISFSGISSKVGKTYKSFEVDTELEDEIEEIEIEFRIEEDWMDDEDAGSTDIRLYKQSEGSSIWAELDTSYDGKSGGYYKFTATDDSFSLFSIVMVLDECNDNNRCESSLNEDETNCPEDCESSSGSSGSTTPQGDTGTTPSEETESSSTIWFIVIPLGILIIIVMIFVIYFISAGKKGKQESYPSHYTPPKKPRAKKSVPALSSQNNSRDYYTGYKQI